MLVVSEIARITGGMSLNETRRCRFCKEILSIDLFTRDRTRPLGHRYSCRPCHANYNRKLRAKDKEHYDISTKKYMWNLRKKLIKLLGGYCQNCGEKDQRILQLNHLKGGGRKDLNKNHNGNVYRAILKGERDETDYNILCSNCNILYEYERGVRWQPTLKY
jgi:hypothetical protein